jgi:hypothetical protein
MTYECWSGLALLTCIFGASDRAFRASIFHLRGFVSRGFMRKRGADVKAGKDVGREFREEN